MGGWRQATEVKGGTVDDLPQPPPDVPSEGYRWNGGGFPIKGDIQGRRKGFYLTDDPAQAPERETFSCGHCQHVTIVEHSQRLDDLGCFCLACARPCCRTCTAKMAAGGMCEPFEKKFDALEAADRLKRAVSF